MFKKYMALLTPDANTEGTSSTSSDENTETSSTSTGEQEQTTGGEEDSHAEVADESGAPTETTGEEQTGDQQNDQQGEEQQTEGEPPLTDKPEDSKLDFHQHPRFQELIREKNEYKTQLDTQKPLADRAKMLDQYCQQNGISEQQIARALEYYRLLNTEPSKAYEMLKADYQRLAQYAGDLLSDDLQAEVAAGTLSPERAKEIAQARAQQQWNGWQRDNQSVSRQQQLIQAVDATINIWADNKIKQDPDLKPGTPLWKYLDSRIKNERMAAPGMSPAQANELVDQLYKEAKGLFKPTPPKNVKRPPNSSQSAGNASAVIKSPEDVARAIMRGMKPHQLKYS